MLTISCPSCGANVNFVSKASIFAVCSYCQSCLVRQDMNLEKVGQISETTDDLTPIQVGTTGLYKTEKFDVIGRLKVAYEGGFWNEWYVDFGGRREAWLVEAQGFFGVCFTFDEVEMPSYKSVQPGKSINFGSLGYLMVENIQDVKCIFSEGELPINAMQGRKSLSVDLSGYHDELATIEYGEHETRVYQGTYQEFDEFQFKNLRPIDGW